MSERADASRSLFLRQLQLRTLLSCRTRPNRCAHGSAVPPADPDIAAQHFARRLQLETDPADVWADIAASAADFVLVDARSPEAFAAAHLPDAVNLTDAGIDATAAATALGRNYRHPGRAPDNLGVPG